MKYIRLYVLSSSILLFVKKDVHPVIWFVINYVNIAEPSHDTGLYDMGWGRCLDPQYLSPLPFLCGFLYDFYKI